ncbi:MAG: hypothetical protein IIT44_08175 [Erysipelotrichaceae bacterium]|nr:hypothetical protein [Erysipelotrichaceae bacterium]
MNTEENKSKYEKIVWFRKYAPLTIVTSLLLCVTSVFAAGRNPVWIIEHIRDFSFVLLLITLCGFFYLTLFTRNLKVNYEYCSIDPTAFNSNVKYAGFGIFLVAFSFCICVLWLIVLLVVSVYLK